MQQSAECEKEMQITESSHCQAASKDDSVTSSIVESDLQNQLEDGGNLKNLHSSKKTESAEVT
jgi:hypothetical protein